MLFFSPAINPLRHIHTPNPSTPLLRLNPKSRVAGHTRDRGASYTPSRYVSKEVDRALDAHI